MNTHVRSILMMHQSSTFSQSRFDCVLNIECIRIIHYVLFNRDKVPNSKIIKVYIFYDRYHYDDSVLYVIKWCDVYDETTLSYFQLNETFIIRTECAIFNEALCVTYFCRLSGVAVRSLKLRDASPNRAVIGSDNGLSLVRRQAIIWTNADLLSIGPLGKKLSECCMEIQNFSLKNMHLKP